MSAKMQTPKKRLFTVALAAEEHELLTAICEARGESKADFLRAAMANQDMIPKGMNTRPNAENGRLRGVCMAKHRARIEREEKDHAKGNRGKHRKS